jgi:hypothetical protein
LITRLDLTASELRKAASGEKNSAAARRILALAEIRLVHASGLVPDNHAMRLSVHRKCDLE